MQDGEAEIWLNIVNEVCESTGIVKTWQHEGAGFKRILVSLTQLLPKPVTHFPALLTRNEILLKKFDHLYSVNSNIQLPPNTGAMHKIRLLTASNQDRLCKASSGNRYLGRI